MSKIKTIKIFCARLFNHHVIFVNHFNIIIKGVLLTNRHHLEVAFTLTKLRATVAVAYLKQYFYTSVKTINTCRWQLQFEIDFSVLKLHRSAKLPTPHCLCKQTFKCCLHYGGNRSKSGLFKT
jgi:hypothetical protein